MFCQLSQWTGNVTQCRLVSIKAFLTLNLKVPLEKFVGAAVIPVNLLWFASKSVLSLEVVFAHFNKQLMPISADGNSFIKESADVSTKITAVVGPLHFVTVSGLCARKPNPSIFYCFLSYKNWFEWRPSNLMLLTTNAQRSASFFAPAPDIKTHYVALV